MVWIQSHWLELLFVGAYAAVLVYHGWARRSGWRRQRHRRALLASVVLGGATMIFAQIAHLGWWVYLGLGASTFAYIGFIWGAVTGFRNMALRVNL